MIKYKIIPYTEQEDKYITDNYSQHTDRQLALMMNRTYDSLKKRREFLGLHKKPSMFDPAYQATKQEIAYEIKVLVNFIELTTSETWREIANVRRKQLLKTLKY